MPWSSELRAVARSNELRANCLRSPSAEPVNLCVPAALRHVCAATGRRHRQADRWGQSPIATGATCVPPTSADPRPHPECARCRLQAHRSILQDPSCSGKSGSKRSVYCSGQLKPLVRKKSSQKRTSSVMPRHHIFTVNPHRLRLFQAKVIVVPILRALEEGEFQVDNGQRDVIDIETIWRAPISRMTVASLAGTGESTFRVAIGCLTIGCVTIARWIMRGMTIGDTRRWRKVQRNFRHGEIVCGCEPSKWRLLECVARGYFRLMTLQV